MKQNKILISACLLGENVKYDGGHNDIRADSFIQKLLMENLLVSICPEVEGGLETPRIPVELIDNKAINQEGEDKTSFFEFGAQKALELCKQHDIKYAILKFRSPSCGSDIIYDGTFTHTFTSGDGITAKLLKENGIKVYSEKNLEELKKILIN
ncbi:DUF523 domain-containing protein [Sulfurospirillum arcachonense]|uniref:DUF523 domain-containing protein n=1 Tax=Sulfurospirillum arcachonense TaxID=57666 RepID=UPI000469A4FA|nr:DUF523 domain-containing protein [Sulfurospirillum arcachonense]